jgi:hypothetical protein
MFTDREIIFEPLNENLKGFYTYKSKRAILILLVGNFEDNTKMGFIVNYKDIAGRPTKIPSPDPQSSQF